MSIHHEFADRALREDAVETPREVTLADHLAAETEGSRSQPVVCDFSGQHAATEALESSPMLSRILREADLYVILHGVMTTLAWEAYLRGLRAIR